jgi:hypothetical protein
MCCADRGTETAEQEEVIAEKYDPENSQLSVDGIGRPKLWILSVILEELFNATDLLHTLCEIGDKCLHCDFKG